jgi:hypothetical protein
VLDAKDFEVTPLSYIKKTLDRLFGKGAWAGWEPETIVIELGIPTSDLLIDKLNVLKIIEKNPLMFFHDPMFFLYAAEAMNNNEVSFESIPSLSMLEAGWALVEAVKISQDNNVKIKKEDYYPLVKTCEYILRMEGASKPITPFTFVPESSLEPGQTAGDTANKELAMEQYIKHMESL